MFGKKKADIAGQEGKQKTNDRKIFAFTMFTIANIFAVSAGTFAWFYAATHNSEMSTVSGDMNVTVQKVEAYKYIYPFFKNSTTMVDYYGEGDVKRFVIQDKENYQSVPAGDTAVFELSATSSWSYDSDLALSATNFRYDNVQTFTRYLVGDSTFLGIDDLNPSEDSDDPWATHIKALAFSDTSIMNNGVEISLNNVVISLGATFTLVDKTTSVTNGKRFTYTLDSEASDSNAPFEAVSGDCIRCLRAGIYNVSYYMSDDKSYLSLTATSRSDDAIIGNNLLDPTMINIDYYGSKKNIEKYKTGIDKYMPDAIQAQKTMVILDVTLDYKNENPIDAGLDVLREGNVVETADHFKASRFYSFYARLAKDENKMTTADEIWTTMHLPGDHQTDSVNDFTKFPDSGSRISCNLLPHDPGSGDSLLVPGSLAKTTYHCYVGIEYDHEHCAYFLDENRLGKTYYLDRDFGFFFTGTQHIES